MPLYVPFGFFEAQFSRAFLEGRAVKGSSIFCASPEMAHSAPPPPLFPALYLFRSPPANIDIIGHHPNGHPTTNGRPILSPDIPQT